MKRTNSLPRKLKDAQLYELLKKGDPNSLEHIHLRYKRLLFWIGKQIVEDDFVVETLVQDVFLKLWLQRDSIETPNHILGFLRFALKRDCLTYYSSPRNKFTRLINSLERYENYQDYLAGYDPAQGQELLLLQESEQKNLDEVKKVLNVLDSKRKHLIELCLEYGFQYKPIAEAMGSSVKDISNEVSRAINDLRNIINGSSFEKPKVKVSENEKQPNKLSSRQLEILKRRFEYKASFSVIALELNLSEKDVHREFLFLRINFYKVKKTLLKHFFEMEKSTITLTRRIQLLIDVSSDEKKAMWEKLYRYQNRCYRAANFIVSHLYVQEMMKDFFYFTEDIQYKLADVNKDEMGMFNRSKTNTTARMVFDKFKGEIPTDILGSLNNTIQSVFSKEKSDYWRGVKSLRNFRKDIPIPLPVKCISKMRYEEETKALCFNAFAIPVKTYLGKDFTDKRLIMERLLRGEIKLCTSQIQLKDKKIYWLAVFEFEKEEHHLKPEIIAEASLSLEHPIVAKANNVRINIGIKEEFLYRRLAIQASQKRIQNGIASARSGKGAKRKKKALYNRENIESRYVNHRLHLYSKQLIDFCIEQLAATLILKNQEDKIGIAKEQKFVLRNWSYYELQVKIKYKAEKAGIELIIG